MFGRRRLFRACASAALGVLLVAIVFLLRAVPSLPHLAQTHTCPACFGTSLCRDVLTGAVHLADLASLTGFLTAIGSKNVFFGMYRGQRVVIKKLAQYAEWSDLDHELCRAAGLKTDCHVNEAFDAMHDVYKQIVKHISQPPAEGLLHSFHLCPTTDKLDVLFTNVVRNLRNVSSHSALAHVWMLVHLNAEPLVLQILPSEEGWPVPKYHGACGRLVVEEYVGDTLLKYTSSSWPMRAYLAQQLLLAAEQLTEHHNTFRFYLTDVSMDNVAVDARGHIHFIDLENIIVLDKQPQYRALPPTWNSAHVSESYVCQDCFAFSADEICSHHISDHNFLAVCQELLAGPDGLLAAIPSAALLRQPSLPVWLQQCSLSPGAGGRRSAALQLAAALSAEAAIFTV